jgi:hypothetical protein
MMWVQAVVGIPLYIEMLTFILYCPPSNSIYMNSHQDSDADRKTSARHTYYLGGGGVLNLL